MSTPPPRTAGAEAPKPKGLTRLAGLVGAIAAAGLFVSVPADESGRKVEATIVAPTSSSSAPSVVVTHKAGPRHLEAYRDIVGVWTACDGIAYVPPGSKFTPAQCDELLERELYKHAAGVLACAPELGRPGRDHQLEATTSLAYNVGVSAVCRSTVVRRFKAGQWRAGCDAFLMWNKAGGKVVRGLTLRRERERRICLKGL